MDFFLLPGPVFATRDEITSKEAFDLDIRFLDRSHDAGFDGVAINHHYASGPLAQTFQPIPLAGHIMARYPDLYVMTAVFILPYHNPIEIAEQVATLDVMAPGKLIFGVGQGYRPDEGDALGIDHKSRPGRMRESIAAMRLLWQDGPASFEGEYYNFRDIDIGLRPVNPKGPPIVVAADKPHTIARIPGLGEEVHWLPSSCHSRSFLREAMEIYRRALDTAGRPYAGLPLQRAIAVADDERAAAELVKKSFTRLLHIQHSWNQPGERLDLPFEELVKDRMIIGSPDQVAAQLVSLHREFGVECFIFQQYTPGMDPGAALEMIDRVGREVVPLVRSEVDERPSLFDR